MVQRFKGKKEEAAKLKQKPSSSSVYRQVASSKYTVYTSSIKQLTVALPLQGSLLEMDGMKQRARTNRMSLPSRICILTL